MKSKFTFLGCVIMTMVVARPAIGDPPPPTAPMDDPLPRVFCFRIMDMERVDLGDGTPNDFAIDFEILNWSNLEATGLALYLNEASSMTEGTVPNLAGMGIDRDGRGGLPGGADIDATGPGMVVGAGTFDATAVHSGRGRGDLPGAMNDWDPVAFSIAGPGPAEGLGTFARWDLSGGGTPVPNRDMLALLPPGGGLPVSVVPGTGVDATGDSAVDGGPAPYTPPSPGAGPPPPGEGNVLDGFTLTVQDWDIGEVLSMNWFIDNFGSFIGTATSGNSFGFGTLSMVRSTPDGPLGSGALFGIGPDAGRNSTGFVQQDFYSDVFIVPPTTEAGPELAYFGAELGAAITGPFLNPGDNQQQMIPVNAEPREVVFCDVNGDQACNLEDIDLIVAAIAEGSFDPVLDVSLDGAVDLIDRDVWLASAASVNGLGSAYLLGDFNLDGSVTGEDFIIWNDNKFTTQVLWSLGNANADTAIDGVDFLLWNDNKFLSSDLSAVPEPGTGCLLMLMLGSLSVLRRRA